MRRLLALVAIGALVVGCGTVLATPDPSASLAVSIRIAAIGQGRDWYGVIHQINGRPDVIKIGPLDCYCEIRVTLAPGVDPGSSIALSACDAIANAVDDPRYGPSLEVSVVTVINSRGSHDCRPPQGPGWS
jgi:hypothetical protein